MKYSIEELEEASEITVEEAISEYVESCLRTGLTDESKIAESFCEENEIRELDFPQIITLVEKELTQY